MTPEGVGNRRAKLSREPAKNSRDSPSLPDPEIVYFGSPSFPSPPENPPEKVGGFAPHPFRWLLGWAAGAAWIPKVDDSGSGGRVVLLISHWDESRHLQTFDRLRDLAKGLASDD